MDCQRARRRPAVRAGRHAFVLLVPVGSRSAIVGEPQTFVPKIAEVIQGAGEPLVRAACALRAHLYFERRERIRFCFPELAPADLVAFGDDEDAVFELVRRRRPTDAARADAGDEAVFGELLLEAITAHRIITRRVLSTWEIAEAMLDLGASRDEAMAAAVHATSDELWARSRDVAG